MSLRRPARVLASLVPLALAMSVLAGCTDTIEVPAPTSSPESRPGGETRRTETRTTETRTSERTTTPRSSATTPFPPTSCAPGLVC